MITVIDYGAGNLRSVEHALARIGASARVVNDAESVANASKLILPGVGHFGAMMHALDTLQLREALRARIADGAPFLGICLGMQALYEGSDEAPDEIGLGLLPGRITRFATSLRVPHMGWNSVDFVRPSRLVATDEGSPYFYFANSYCASEGPDTTGVCTYGVRFAAVVERANTFGVQFHPEKSGATGLRLLQNFAALASC